MKMVTAYPQRLPLLRLNNRDYFIDRNLREFRSLAIRSADGDSVPFDTPRGQLLWKECLIATCPQCGLERVEPRHASGVKCERCGQWVLL